MKKTILTKDEKLFLLNVFSRLQISVSDPAAAKTLNTVKSIKNKLDIKEEVKKEN